MGRLTTGLISLKKLMFVSFIFVVLRQFFFYLREGDTESLIHHLKAGSHACPFDIMFLENVREKLFHRVTSQVKEYVIGFLQRLLFSDLCKIGKGVRMVARS